MLRLLIISDFTESFTYRLLKGIVDYSRANGHWELCRVPSDFKKIVGIPGVVKLAKEWGANAVIGQFEQTDNISLFIDSGIVVIAQDFKRRFKRIPNITGDYVETGKMAASYFLQKGFRNFAFFGFNDVCWSDERELGFKQVLEKAKQCDNYYNYKLQDIDIRWYYERETLTKWLKQIKKPIAIFACDDNQASYLINACISNGIKVPSEVCVLGVDNDEVICSLSTPMLSSILIDVEKGGFQTAALIDRLVRNPHDIPEDIILHPVKIIERISTASIATNDFEIQKAVEYIHKNQEHRISVKEVLAAVPLSRRLLENRFKSVTNESVYQYISKLRVKRFADMLVDTMENVNNIAITLGETDAKNLSRKFKSIYGCSPLEYRERKKH